LTASKAAVFSELSAIGNGKTFSRQKTGSCPHLIAPQSMPLSPDRFLRKLIPILFRSTKTCSPLASAGAGGFSSLFEKKRVVI
jgi:hypothetical protein